MLIITELWNLLDFIVPGFLGTIEEFRRLYVPQRLSRLLTSCRYINPIKMGQKHDAIKHEIGKYLVCALTCVNFLLALGRLKSKKLATVLKKHILRRDKSIIADLVPSAPYVTGI